MLGDVSTFLRILRSVSSSGLKVKLEGSDQSILEGPTIFEDKCICCLLGIDGLVWMDLAVSSVSIFSNSSMLERLC